MKRRWMALLCVSALLLAACSASAGSAENLTERRERQAVEVCQPDAALTAALLDFSLALYNEAVEADQNCLLSPLSIYVALNMAATGAEGATRAQLEQALTGGAPLAEKLPQLASLLQDERSAQVTLANSVWFDKNRVKPLDGFLQGCVDWFDADVFTADFSQPSSVNAINEWVSGKTKGRIEKLVDRNSQDTVMWLVNAICFDSMWQSPFGKPYNDTFHAPDGDVPVKLMSVSLGSCAYLLADGWSGVRLPYDDSPYSFVALLPDENGAVARSWTADEWRALLASEQSAALEVTLPKFKTTWDGNVAELVQALGVTDAFDITSADFSGINGERGLAIDRILHKTMLEVDSDGTKAAAATAVGVTDTAAMPSSMQLVFDRPFVYAVIDNTTGLPLFIGQMCQP